VRLSPHVFCERGQERADFGKFGLRPPRARFSQWPDERLQAVFVGTGCEEITRACFPLLLHGFFGISAGPFRKINGTGDCLLGQDMLKLKALRVASDGEHETAE